MTTKVEDGKIPGMGSGGTYPGDSGSIPVQSDASNSVYGAYTVISADIGSKDIYLSTLISTDVQDGLPVFAFAIGAGGSEVNFLEVQQICKGTNQENMVVSLGLVRVPANSRLAVQVKDAKGSAVTWSILLNHVSV